MDPATTEIYTSCHTLSLHDALPIFPVLSMAAGENTAILGANGSGKSTLVKLIARELYPAWGADVRIFGQDSWNVFELRRHLGIVSSTMQLDFDAEPPLEVLDCVVSGFFASRGLWAHQHYTQDMIRSEEHTSELQSLMRISYAVLCLKTNKQH